MCPQIERVYFDDGSFIEGYIEVIHPDLCRPHGVRYRLAWVKDDQCIVLFDNHHGKSDHYHIGKLEFRYEFTSIDELIQDFLLKVREQRVDL